MNNLGECNQCLGIKGEHILMQPKTLDPATDAWVRSGINQKLYPNGDYVYFECPSCGTWEWKSVEETIKILAGRKCRSCSRTLTGESLRSNPELLSGYCNWCKPEQIPTENRVWSSPSFFMKSDLLLQAQFKGIPIR